MVKYIYITIYIYWRCFILRSLINSEILGDYAIQNGKTILTKELDMEDRAQGLIERGMTVIENDAIKRLELMVIGLSKSIDNIEKLLNRVSVKQEPLVSNFTQFLGKPLKQLSKNTSRMV